MLFVEYYDLLVVGKQASKQAMHDTRNGFDEKSIWNPFFHVPFHTMGRQHIRV